MIKFEEKLKRKEYDEIWQEYCGFLDLTISDYMKIQNRLMLEQINLWSNSKLGEKLLNGKKPKTIDEFRELLPLTSYEDYAEVLLTKKADMLPDEPVIWIQTTWEGGLHPIKLAPYTKGMIKTYKNNVLACMILSTSKEKGKFDVKPKDTMLYALAPLPFATGLFPVALGEEINIEFLPSVKEAAKLSFGERNKLGFKMGMTKGIDFFFGLGSVAYFVSLAIASLGEGAQTTKKAKAKVSPKFAMRYIKAKKSCKESGRTLKPKDLFHLKGFMCAGTDNNGYKDDLEDLWGIRPMELFAGTEPSIIGTETWTRNGMYFFPDTCFYEFIPETEMNRSLADKNHKPRTMLMNQVVPGEKYEIAITVLKGGAFARYRVGDVYECIGLENSEDQTRIPRFRYVDRIPSIIDIAGFTRISENSISKVIDYSGIKSKDWFAQKEYTEKRRPFLHLFIELDEECLEKTALSKQILQDHLSIYFKYLDQDYENLKKILGVDPLKITILRNGVFDEYYSKHKKPIRKINPMKLEVFDILKIQESDFHIY